MLFVFDTNTLVSAIIKPEGMPLQALLIAQRVGTIIFSPETKDEMRSVIQRKVFDKYLPMEDRIKMTEEIISKAMLIETASVDRIECRDPADIKFLRLAYETHARCLVSGDADLKVLNPFRGIPILSIVEFIRIFSVM